MVQIVATTGNGVDLVVEFESTVQWNNTTSLVTNIIGQYAPIYGAYVPGMKRPDHIFLCGQNKILSDWAEPKADLSAETDGKPCFI